MAQSWWQWLRGWGILGLSVVFLGSTIRLQTSETDSRSGMSRATRELLGPGACDATCALCGDRPSSVPSVDNPTNVLPQPCSV